MTRPPPHTPTRWHRIEAAAVRCLALLARPEHPAAVRAAEKQRRVDIAAQANARTHGRDC